MTSHMLKNCAEDWGIPLKPICGHEKALAKSLEFLRKKPVEARYKLFNKCCKIPTSIHCRSHNRDDQAETLSLIF